MSNNRKIDINVCQDSKIALMRNSSNNLDSERDLSILGK